MFLNILIYWTLGFIYSFIYPRLGIVFKVIKFSSISCVHIFLTFNLLGQGLSLKLLNLLLSLIYVFTTQSYN